MEQIATPYAYYRGGTSKAAIVLAEDLPVSNEADLDAWILAIYGSPDRRQIDGIGGAEPLTSKFAVVGPPSRPDADLDYSFHQVDIVNPTVYRNLNCGNISAAIAAFAIDAGLVSPREPATHVRIHATNFGRIIHATVPVKDGKARILGSQRISGVPGTGAAITLDFRDTAGGRAGRLLPTGNAVDRLHVEGVGSFDVSIVDLGNLVCYLAAKDLGLQGTEGPLELEQNEGLVERCEAIRMTVAVELGLVPDMATARRTPMSTPWLSFVSPPQPWVDFATGAPHLATECDVTARLYSRRGIHKAYPGSGSACIGAASKIPGTIVHRVAASGNEGRLRIGHPCGVLEVTAAVDVRDDGEPVVLEASFPRTARRIADGRVYAAVDRLPWLSAAGDPPAAPGVSS